MKKVKIIVIWAMLSIMLQCAGFLYLDQIYFTNSSEFEKIELPTIEKNRDINYKMPVYAEKINVSDDTKYIFFFKDDELKILDTNTLNVKNVLDDKEILYCDWILNEDILMIAEKNNRSIDIITYNVKNDFVSKLTTLCTYEEGSVVDDISSSTKTNTHYVGVSRTG